MRILVTGGAGFIGSHLVDRLILDGHQVVVVDDLSTGREENLASAINAGASLELADITERQTVETILNDFRPQTVFHLAAQIDVRRSVREPGFDAMVNVVGTVNILDASCEAGVGRLVFVSTGGAMYGEGEGLSLPLNEGAEIGALSPYGHSKYAAETYLDFFKDTQGLQTVSLRLGNVYGPRQDPKGEAGVVAIFTGKLKSGKPLTIFGDGEQTRDYIFVEDIADACVLAGESRATGALNIGTGKQTSVLDLVRILGEASGTAPVEVQFEPERPGEVRAMSLDSTKALELLGWSPSVGIEEGLRLTLRAGAEYPDPTSA
ncbi:MAG: NAD-dependent epimerase/dehydratase family protein [Solirubrobacterales bacterium]